MSLLYPSHSALRRFFSTFHYSLFIKEVWASSLQILLQSLPTHGRSVSLSLILLLRYRSSIHLIVFYSLFDCCSSEHRLSLPTQPKIAASIPGISFDPSPQTRHIFRPSANFPTLLQCSYARCYPYVDFFCSFPSSLSRLKLSYASLSVRARGAKSDLAAPLVEGSR